MYFGFARNPITQVPLALTECTEITDMSFEACTQLSIIPKNLLAMRKLRNISLKNCNLAHLPSVISQHLNSLIITGNRLMKWIPFDALPFLSFDTDFLDILEDEWVLFFSFDFYPQIDNRPQTKLFIIYEHPTGHWKASSTSWKNCNFSEGSQLEGLERAWRRSRRTSTGTFWRFSFPNGRLFVWRSSILRSFRSFSLWVRKLYMVTSLS